ncbi:MAG: O-methyltransferase [Chloroflexi bacterium]|nr:MAG: O-methyltransferase [Chloroflexota bacterium]
MRNSMSGFTLRDLEYVESLHGRLAPVFAKMDEEGARGDIPIVGTSVGRTLSVLVRAIGARRVVEVGTAIGYSTLWMALAMPHDGRVVTIDPDRSRTDRAREFWSEAGVADRIQVVSGKALEELPKLRGPFDLAFIDALKPEYEGYLSLVLPLLRDGGTVAVDNLLWSGRASGAVAADDESTNAIRSFNRRFVSHPQLDATILPVGDGLGVGVKLAR